eukprot:GSMAST32.ASY1.ANO1.130.1 assembled CDS
MVYRKDCIEAWSSVLRSQKVPCSETREWTINKLPNDSFSIDNAIILDKSARWPLMIDPQMQANKWVRNMESETEPPLKICKQNEATFSYKLINVLMCSFLVTINGTFTFRIAKSASGGVETIRVGDTYVEYDQRFKLYITTKLPNPHFPPEICVQKGLEDQMLGIVVSAERPDLATQLQQLVVEDAANQKKLTELEDKILHLLASAEGNILDDSVLIKALGDSKITSDQIMAQVKTRKEYQPFFINLFLVAIERALTSKKVSKRVSYLNDSMLRVLYQNVCRSLFEKDKLMFSFMLTSTILIMSKKITMSHLRFFVQGSTSLKLAKPNPCKALSEQTGYESFAELMSSELSKWAPVMTGNDNPIDLITELVKSSFPEVWDVGMILRCLRPDYVTECVQKIVIEHMGREFVEPPAFDLAACYEDATNVIPLIFVLAPGQGSWSWMPSLEKIFLCCRHEKAFKKMLFGLSFFHALVRERCSYGPLGWNIPYAFSEPDLRISIDQLRNILDVSDFIPYSALNYLVSECNYGGRVTDDKDRRYMTYIKSLPLVEGPEIFGMHNNASITSATQETNYLFSTILSMTWEDTLSILANKIERRIPELYDIEKVVIDYPITYSESMNTVLVQELERFNRAITGEVVMSKALLQMGTEMSDGLVPEMWSSVAYPSLCPLGSWVTDLLKRLKFFDEWIDGGVPAIFWISGFFFTQAFLTGTRQNFARKYTIPIDLVEWDFSVLSPAESNKVNERAPDGAYVQGMFLDGAGWDVESMVLCESAPKVLYTPMMTHSYKTPLYKTSERRGMLSTTGHSTNFVLMFELPMGKEHSEKHWVKRGVAMLTQLDD